MGLALAAVPDERGRIAVPPGLLQAADWTAVLAIAVAALGVAATDTRAAVTLAGIALVQLAGNLPPATTPPAGSGTQLPP